MQFLAIRHLRERLAYGDFQWPTVLAEIKVIYSDMRGCSLQMANNSRGMFDMSLPSPQRGGGCGDEDEGLGARVSYS